MANTKVTKAVLANDAVGLAQLDISNDPSNGQALTYDETSTNLQWATISGGASDINGLSDAKTFGTSSIMIGDSTTGTIDAANNNVGLGVDVFAALTSGDDNVAIGFAALTANTTGSNNTAVGRRALVANTTGSDNEAFGRHALESNTTGSQNCGLGRATLSFNTTGNNNVAVGYAALGDNTGSYNTGVGVEALTNNTSATHNVAVGFRALNTVTTTGDNVAIGNYALYSNASTRNVAVGYSAGYNSTGSDNVLIGMDAGQGSYPLTSGSSCTMVGRLARPSGTLGNANSENVFGFNMSANGTNTTTLGSSGSGLYASHGSNSWTSISDERYKKDIVDSEVGLSFINDLRPRNFKWKTCGEVPSDTPRYEENSDELINPNLTGVMHGFIAQEIKAVIDNHSEVPNNQLIWKEDPDGIQGLAEGELVPALVKAIQELSAKNDALEARIETLEAN